MLLPEASYYYGGRDAQNLDCWGYIYLYYQHIGITIPEYLDYLIDYPQHDRIHIRGVLRRIKSSGFIRIDSPIEHCVLIRIRPIGFAFAIWCEGEVRRMTDDGFSRSSWGEFVGCDRVLMYRWAPDN
jgi:NlpC/P60 family